MMVARQARALTVCAVALACILSVAPLAAGWSSGRATFYDDAAWMSVHTGSCMFGHLDDHRFPGWQVAALSESFPGFQGSCGRCYEVRCKPGTVRDGYGAEMDRSDVCFNGQASVVVTVTDSCPCYKPENVYSNRRWCCGDVDHMDLSVWAFEKLADRKWGVIAIEYQPVECGTQPWSAAQAKDGVTPRGVGGVAGSGSPAPGSSPPAPSSSPAPGGWSGTTSPPAPTGSYPAAAG